MVFCIKELLLNHKCLDDSPASLSSFRQIRKKLEPDLSPSGGGFLRQTLHVVVRSATKHTRYGVKAAAKPAAAGLFPAPPPCYASGYCHIGKKSDLAESGFRQLR